MLMPVINDSYRGVRVSSGINDLGEIYFRLEFIGETWKQIVNRPDVDGQTVADALGLGNVQFAYHTSESGYKVFLWSTKLSNFRDNSVSLFTFLNDIFHRVDRMSPIPRGSILHPVVKEGFKQFVKAYAFKDTKESYTNGAELVPVFRVLDALDMVESGQFGYNESCVDVAKAVKESHQEPKPLAKPPTTAPGEAKRRKKSKKVAKVGA